MEAVAAFTSLRCNVGTIPHAFSVVEKPDVVPMYTTISKPLFPSRLGRSLVSSPLERKRSFLPQARASEATSTLYVKSDDKPSGNSSGGQLEKKKTQATTFPNGLEALVLEVCDETDVAELKVKVGDFEMRLKRNIGAITGPTPPVLSPSTPPDIPSKPMVESVSASPPVLPQRSSLVSTNPFTNVVHSKASKLALLEGPGTNSYVIVPSPTVGSFRRGRTVKGKKQPPICKEGDIIKEGQVIGYLDQFGNELPVKSDVAGEVLKLLFQDGEAVGYGDPLIAVLPSFHGIK